MIPLLDFGRWQSDPEGFTAVLGAACRGPGFFLLNEHGIAQELMAGAFAQAEAFFAQPFVAKDALSIYRSPHNRGYARLGSERLDDTGDEVNQKEAFNIGLDLAAYDPRVLAGEPFRGVNFWPDLDGFRETVSGYFDAVWALGVALHRPIARDLGLPEDHFAGSFDAPMATLRLLHYPPGDEGGRVRIQIMARSHCLRRTVWQGSKSSRGAQATGWMCRTNRVPLWSISATA